MMAKAENSPFALLARAEALLQTRNAPEAAKLARLILRKDREHVGALEVLARSQWQQQKFETLVATTRRLIKLDPYNPGYHMLLGAALQCLGRFGEATRAYLRASNEGGTPETERSLRLIAELRDWQAGLLATLLNEDLAFRAAYNRDPKAACQSRGFEFLETQPVVGTWVHEGPALSALSVRPS